MELGYLYRFVGIFFAIIGFCAGILTHNATGLFLTVISGIVTYFLGTYIINTEIRKTKRRKIRR